MKKLNRNIEGITLIALVVTIVVLLILAGVTITMVLGQDGIITKAQNAAQLTLIANEREYLEQNAISTQLSNILDDTSSKKLGKTLYDRNLENSSIWDIVVEQSTNKIYGTGWNYVEKGTELYGYGEAKYNWLLNYETGEIVQLEENNYLSLSAGDMLAIKDSLIINVDSSIIDEDMQNDDETTLEKQLGNNVDLVNFNYNENSGLTSTSFNFDGVDDYIQVEYSNEEQKEALLKNGFTFEYYGTLNDGTSYYKNFEPMPEGYEDYTHYKGLFCFWNGIADVQADLRFGLSRRWKHYKVECRYSSSWRRSYIRVKFL